MASTAQDDGLHEIQLNGKQLVFLFMAATVVSVVIFLCGVLVGRGVRPDRAASVDVAAMSEPSLPLTPAPVSVTPVPPAADSDPRSAAPPPPVADDTTYFNRLEAKSPNAAEDLKGPSSVPRSDAPAAKLVAPAGNVDAPVDRKPVKARETAPSRTAVAAAAPMPATAGYTVQVAAVNVKKEAEQIAKRLEGKGYPAFVIDPARGTPAMFRVRVGSFKTRDEAESMATKLQQQERFQPWVTR